MALDRIGPYRVDRSLGRGAFASVWLAYDEGLDARVALKVLAENWVADDDVRRRFTEEARILWRLDSDRMVRVYGVHELDDGRPYFVMEYADLGTLADRMAQRSAAGEPFSVAEAVRLGVDVAEGLVVAHGLGVAHRDLKPSNILFRSVAAHHGDTRSERMVLADFGIARSLENAGRTTIAAGTPHYMAPEQFRGHADARSDVYAAAVILYELLSGQVPYPYDSIGELIRAQLTEPPPPIRAVRPDVPDALERLLGRGLMVDPDERVSSAGDWAAGLREFVDVDAQPPVGVRADTITAIPAGASRPDATETAAGAPAVPAVPAVPVDTAPEPASGGGRRRWLLPALALAGIAALVVVVALMSHGKPKRSTVSSGSRATVTVPTSTTVPPPATPQELFQALLAHNVAAELLPTSFSFRPNSPGGRMHEGVTFSDPALRDKHHVVGGTVVELNKGSDAAHNFFAGTNVFADVAGADETLSSIRANTTAQISTPPGFEGRTALCSVRRNGATVYCFAQDGYAIAYGDVEYSGSGDPATATALADATALTKAALADLRKLRGE